VKTSRQLRGLAYRVFYGLPLPLRRQIARAVSPKYLVGAVTVVRDTDADAPGRLLLLRQPPGRGWGLPAGLLKRGELPAVGAARELFEEAGVRVEPGALTPGNPNAVIHPNGGVVDTVWFGAVPASSTPLVVDGGEVYEAAWFPVDDLPKLTWPTERLLGIYGIGPRAGELPESVPPGDSYRGPAGFPQSPADSPVSPAGFPQPSTDSPVSPAGFPQSSTDSPVSPAGFPQPSTDSPVSPAGSGEAR
jgi:8-oxo-dGTP diphosphatase